MNFDFIPRELYTLFFNYAMLFVVIVYFFKLQQGFKKSKFGFALVLLIIIYMGFRPLSGKWFGDMATYNYMFLHYQQGGELLVATDIFFQIFIRSCSKIMSPDFFFLLCAFLYVYPLYLVSKKWFDRYWFYSFLFLVTAFSFWAYGTNGIRNGIATSLFLLGMSRDKRFYQIMWILLAINFHKTMLLPAMGYLLAIFYNRPKNMIFFWILSIPVSLALGSALELFVASLGLFEDERVSYLIEGNVNKDDFSSTGFRWDFVTYSATAVFAGWYYIFKKNFNDKIYFFIFNIYLIANSFWILIIRANFSNRFAYLSWFLIGLVIIYPLLKQNLVENQNRKVSVILVIYFFFTYFMNVILAK